MFKTFVSLLSGHASYQYSVSTVQHNYFILKTIHFFIKVQQHKNVYYFYKNSFVSIFIVVIMYDFF
jgi:hypothetical protein